MLRQKHMEAIKAAAATASSTTPSDSTSSDTDWRAREYRMIREVDPSFDSSLLCPLSLPDVRAAPQPAISSAAHPNASADVLLAVSALGDQKRAHLNGQLSSQLLSQLSGRLPSSLSTSPSSSFSRPFLSGSCPATRSNSPTPPQLSTNHPDQKPPCHPELLANSSVPPYVCAPVHPSPLGRAPGITPANRDGSSPSAFVNHCHRDGSSPCALAFNAHSRSSSKGSENEDENPPPCAGSGRSNSAKLQASPSLGSSHWHTHGPNEAGRGGRRPASFEIHAPAPTEQDPEDSHNGKPDLLTIHDMEQASLQMDMMGDGVIGSITIVPLSPTCGNEEQADPTMSIRYALR